MRRNRPRTDTAATVTEYIVEEEGKKPSSNITVVLFSNFSGQLFRYKADTLTAVWGRSQPLLLCPYAALCLPTLVTKGFFNFHCRMSSFFGAKSSLA